MMSHSENPRKGEDQVTAKTLQSLTDKQLEAEWTKDAKELEKLKDRLRKYSEEHQRRAAEERARQTLATLSDTEREALLQAVSAEGIESQEAVNNG